MIKTLYQQWLNEPRLEAELKKELVEMTESDMSEAFYKPLTFGTGGMRGIVGVGINRMNIYTVRKAIQGYALFLLKTNPNAKEHGVVIAYDNRHFSQDFAKAAVEVLAKNGIQAYLFEAIRPTPLLSYAVRDTHAAGGIMVTASHNPPQYNGVKMYDSDGCQLIPRLADQVIELVNDIDDVFSIETMPFDIAKAQGLVEILGRNMDNKYLNDVYQVQYYPNISKLLKVVFTPLHGASREIGLRSLVENGYDVYPVEAQMIADPNFSTVKSPNPEDVHAFAMAEALGKEKSADLLIATDPDGDRLGVAVYHDKKYHYLTGNQTGALFIDYMLKTLSENDALPPQGVLFNTIVTNDFGAAIARHYGVEMVSTLTGFKFIGEKMKAIENSDKTFIMGYEESYGYVLKDIVRDKDSIQAIVLISEMANRLKQEGKTLIDALNTLYDTHGAYRDQLVNIALEGQAGEKAINQIMQAFRKNAMTSFLNRSLIYKEDYQLGERYENGQTSVLNFPQSDVLKFMYEDFWFVLRPSGTEPKLKIYCIHKGKTIAEADAFLETLKAELIDLVEQYQTKNEEVNR